MPKERATSFGLMHVVQKGQSAKPQIGILLLQLGGPKTQEDIPAFLEELFADVLPLPRLVARPIARLIAKRRMPEVGPLYQEIGGGSPLLANTQAQSDALTKVLASRGIEAHVHMAMRYAPPRAEQALAAMRALGPSLTWLALPLYPQYSFATTRSSLDELYAQMTDEEVQRLHVLTAYPCQRGYVDACVQEIVNVLDKLPEDKRREAHLVYSAHGLPLQLVRQGDPYPEQIQASVTHVHEALCHKLEQKLGYTLSFQSRVGPVKWLSPSTEDTMKRLGGEGHEVLIVVPIAFVSEHIETMHELDIQLQETAREAGVTTYRRVPTVSVHPAFIEGLADAVEATLVVGPTPPGALSLRAARRRGAAG